jgi:hypothetical protein
MTTLISHRKSMSLDLSIPPIQVFDGESKIQNTRPNRKQQTKYRGTISRSFVRAIFSFLYGKSRPIERKIKPKKTEGCNFRYG